MAKLGFGYRITAIRRKYESVRFADHTNDPDPRKQMEEMKARRGNVAPASHDPSKKLMPVAARTALLTRSRGVTK